MSKFFFLFFLLLLACTISLAQKKNPVAATVDRNKILIGEQFDLILDARFPDVSSAGFFAVDSFPHFEIIAKSKVDTAAVGNEVLLSQRITLTSWDSGRWQLPSLALTRGLYKTKPIVMDVVFSSPFDPKQDYHDVKDILNVQKPTETKWYWYLLGALLVIGLFIILFPGKKKEKVETVIHPDAFKTALADLHKLKKEQATKEAKVFYSGLIDVFRKYLLQRKGIHSFSQTTDDLALQIKPLQLSKEAYGDLVETLQLSDAVKFAKFMPTEEEKDESLIIIRKTIEAIENK